mgnify:CR=1 FL=1
MPAHKVAFRQCAVPGCDTNAASSAGGKGSLCMKHYKRKMRHGEPTAGRVENGKVRDWILAHVAYQGDDCIMCPHGVQGRYRSSTLTGKKTTASRTMCTLAHGDPPSDDMDAAHSCGNGHLGCLNPKHLSWKTKSDNQNDRFLHGTDDAGEKSSRAKLSSAQVAFIRENPEGLSAARIARMLGVSDTHVLRIQKRKVRVHD